MSKCKCDLLLYTPVQGISLLPDYIFTTVTPYIILDSRALVKEVHTGGKVREDEETNENQQNKESPDKSVTRAPLEITWGSVTPAGNRSGTQKLWAMHWSTREICVRCPVQCLQFHQQRVRRFVSRLLWRWLQRIVGRLQPNLKHSQRVQRTVLATTATWFPIVPASRTIESCYGRLSRCAWSFILLTFPCLYGCSQQSV